MASLMPGATGFCMRVSCQEDVSHSWMPVWWLVGGFGMGVLRFWGIRYECLGSQRYIEPEKSTKLQHERERSKKWYYVEPERSNDGSDLGAD